jgi:hypothetical protein
MAILPVNKTIAEGPFAKITSLLYMLHHGKSLGRHLRSPAA